MGNETILGIDPGSSETGFALVRAEDYSVKDADKLSNEDMLNTIYDLEPSQVAVESIQSYGMPVGRTVFETCFFIGRIQQLCHHLKIPCHLYPRPEIIRSICQARKTNDSVLRQALLLRFGGDKKGEPLNLLKGSTDKRSAYAAAVYHIDWHYNADEE